MKTLNDAKTLVIKDTTFYFKKMPAMKAYDISEYARESVVSVFESSKIDDETDLTIFQLVKMLLKVDRHLVETVRNQMFHYIEFSSLKSSKQKLAGAEDTAFENLGWNDVYRVFMESLSVNFADGFQELISGARLENQGSK